MLSRITTRRAWLMLVPLMCGIFAAPALCDDLRAVRADPPPTIDGDLGDACWKAATAIGGFTILDTKKPSPLKTEVRFAYDDDTLYIAVECFTPDFSLVKGEKVERDGRVLNLDSVELMIDADRDGDEYIHLMTNATGSQFDRRVVQSGWVGINDWDGDWRTASTIGADSYTVEVAIPFYSLDIGAKTSSTWNVNVCRNVRTADTFAYTSIAPGGVYNVPAKFPSLSGIHADFSRYMLRVSPVRTSSCFADGKTHITVAVDVANEAAVPQSFRAENWLIDAGEKVRIKEIDEVVLPAGERRTLSFAPYVLEESGTYQDWTILLDPATRRPVSISKSAVDIECVPIALRVEEPFYRNTIFASQELTTVRLAVDVGLEAAEMAVASLHLKVTPAEEKKDLVSKTLKGLSQVNYFEFPCATLPGDGKFIARVVLSDGAGNEIARTEQTILKLPYRKGEVWIGRDRVFRRDGKPFFPNGAWGQMTPARNFLLLGVSNKLDESRREMDLGPGKLKAWLFWNRPDHEELKGPQPLSEAYIESLRQRIRFYREAADLFAWVNADEPECSGYVAEKLRQTYEIVREEDPYHPVLMSNNSVSGIKTYTGCTDAAVPHPYPAASPESPIGDFTKIVLILRAYDEHTGRRTPFGLMHQGFNYGEYVRGRRMPSYYELRNQNVLALALGATIAMGFEGGNPAPHMRNPEVGIGLPYLTEELAYLGRAMIAPTAANEVTCASKDVVTLLKTLDGELYLFVSNAASDPRTLSVTVGGLEARKMAVISEGREVALKRGVVTDSFNSWQSHVYTTNSKPTGLKTIKEIIGMVEAEYARRQKPGNLAFQRWSNQSVDITSSSRDGIYPPEPWHVCDGLTDAPRTIEIQFKNQFSWSDGTPNESPDWVALKFKKPHSIKRVVVYTEQESIKDYQIQVREGDNWIDVAHGKNNNAAKIEHSFKPVTTDQVRLLVTATNGPHVTVSEIEVY